MESSSASSNIPRLDLPTVDLQAGDQVYRLRPIGTNEICALEEQTGKVFGQLMIEVGVFGIERVSLSTVRGFIKYCLLTPLDDTQVGALIDEVGFTGISAAINKLVIPAQVATPEEKPKRQRKERTH